MKYVAAVAAQGATVGFVLATLQGQRVRGGIVDEDVTSLSSQIGTVIIADYGLLDSPGIIALSSVKVQLLEPDRLNVLLDADGVLRRWSQGGSVATVHPSEVDLIAPYVGERRRTLARLHQTKAEIEDRVRRGCPRYAALLERNGSLDPRIFPVLARFPTPRTLRSAGPIQLSRLVEPESASGRRALLDGLVSLSNQDTAQEMNRGEASFVERVLPGLVGEHTALQNQVETIDRSIFRIASEDHRTHDQAEAGHAPILPVVPAWAAGRFEVEAYADDLMGLARQLAETLHQAPCAPASAYERYRAAREVLADELTAAESLELELIGQHLALAAGDLTAAARHQAVVDSLNEPHGRGGGLFRSSCRRMRR